MAQAKVLLATTTNWPCTPRLMIELLRAGHAVSIVCPKRHCSEKIRAYHETFPYEPFSALNSLARAIHAAKPDIIVPCDDLAVRHLHLLYASKRVHWGSRANIQALIAYSLGDPESFPIVASRQDLLDIARQEGILTPETTALRDTCGLESVIANMPFPWALKAGGTFGGTGVRIASTPAEARAGYADLVESIGLLRVTKRLFVNGDALFAMKWRDQVRGVRPEVVAQKFIYGRPANCAVFCWNGNVLAGVGCEVVSEKMALGPAHLVRLIGNAEMMDAAAKLARRLKLSGFFGLDFMIAEETGSPFLIEMNPRCVQLCHLRLGTGRDMVGALSAVLTGEQAGDEVPVTQNNLVAYFPKALLTGSDLLSSSYLDVPWDEPDLIRELIRAELAVLPKEKRRIKLRSVFRKPRPTSGSRGR